jgi:hydroxymethylglutaryl-CoA synthase
MSGAAGKVGLLSYGHYVPQFRVDISVFSEQWGLTESLEKIYRLNGRNGSAVNALDEDTVTLSIEAGERALALGGAGAARPRSVMIGSESHPYAVKPSSVIVGDALGLAPDMFAVDLEFACKGGTAALFLSLGLVASGQVPAALAIGADCPQSAPGSLLEASVGAGASAFWVGAGEGVIAEVSKTAAASSDATDFWRRDGAQFPSVVGKFSSEIGYEEHTCRVVRRLLDETGTKPEDYKILCLHQPYQSLPLSVGKKLGFKQPQIAPALVAAKIGNTYSSACLLSLCGVLDNAEPGDKMMLVSFGSGAGSDGFVFTVTDEIKAFRARKQASGQETVVQQIGNDHVEWLTYGQYILSQGKLRS